MLFYHLRGGILLILYILNALFWILCVAVLGLIKSFFPRPSFQIRMAQWLSNIAYAWTSINNGFHFLNKIKWDVELPEGLKQGNSYLIIANHQSWVDTLVLMKVFKQKIPAPRFFIKPPKKWDNLFRLIYWYLDFPVVQYYSKNFLKQYPELKGKDLEITRKFCDKFKSIPVSIVIFPEGTRYTPQKHENQQSPYQHLLRPKAGGLAMILSELGPHVDGVLNLTIVYPKGSKRFWDFLCGRMDTIIVRSEKIKFTVDLQGDYSNDAEFQSHFQNWINQLWHQKDQILVECNRSDFRS